MAQSPAGFIPRVYYGLTQGNQVYRFAAGAEFEISDLPGNVGDSFSIISTEQVSDYISGVAIMTDTDTIKIQIQGDYPLQGTNYTLVNMRTGVTKANVLAGQTSLQDASYLGGISAADNKNKQITVLDDIELGINNVIFASLDLNSDDVWNWVKIGTYLNGTDGASIFGITNATIATVLTVAQAGDLLLAGEAFTYNGITFAIGDLKTILSLSPSLSVSDKGNVRGPKGETGETGQNGQDGVDGLTPTIVDGYWYIGGVSTGVVAVGQDGANGQDGTAFNIQSGLYSTEDNWGESGNVGPNSETLLQLPTLPQSNISGKGYIVYDPLTTPLNPYYDLYWANNGDNDWTVIHPFNGINGANGSDGYTPYIDSGTGNWFINGVDTGVHAQGPQGGTGATGQGVPSGGTTGQVLTKVDGTDYNTEWANPSGGSLYRHSIDISFYISAGATAHAILIIDTASNVAMTSTTLAAWLYANGFNSNASRRPYYTNSLVFYENRLLCGFYSTNGEGLSSRIMEFTIVDNTISINAVGGSVSSVIDTVTQIL